MSSSSREERQRLKEEYKAHYRQLLEQKKKLTQQQRLSRLMQQARDMEVSATPVLERVQQSLGSLQQQIAKAEARLEVYLDDKTSSETQRSSESDLKASEQAEEFSRKEAARNLIKNIRREMNEIGKPAFSEGLQDPETRDETDKTRSAGQESHHKNDDPARNDPEVRKTIGSKADSPGDDRNEKENS
jgi:transglutaminase/protease-like cytokinesis protein 3